MTGLGHDRGLGVQANVGDCFLQFRYVIAEPAESSVAPCTKCPSHLFRSVVMVNHQKPLPLLLRSWDLSTESTAPVLFSAKLGVLGQSNSVKLLSAQIISTIPAGVIQTTTADLPELVNGKNPLAEATHLFALTHPGESKTNPGMFLESMVDNCFSTPATGHLRPAAIKWVGSLRASGRVAQYVTRHELVPAPRAWTDFSLSWTFPERSDRFLTQRLPSVPFHGSAIDASPACIGRERLSIRGEFIHQLDLLAYRANSLRWSERRESLADEQMLSELVPMNLGKTSLTGYSFRGTHRPSRFQVSRTARRIAAARVTSQKAASFSKMFRSSLESNRCNWMSFGCICTKYRPDKYPRQGESKEKVYEKVRGLLPREGGWINGLTASRFGRLRFSQDQLRSLGRESGPDYPVNCWNTLKLRRHNVTCKGERDGLKSSAMTQWAISSQASHRLEGSTIIPSGSRAKRLEARDAHMGEDMTSSFRKREADQE